MNRRAPFLSVLLLSACVAGCSSNLFSEAKLQPIKFFDSRDWASPGSSAEASLSSGPVAPEDLVDAAGACPAAAASSAPVPGSAVGTPAGDLGGQTVVVATVAGGVALGMSECQVVQRAGQPGNVQISADANGERATVITYMSGNWPGIYRFSGGRLKEIERVAMPEPPKPAKPVKKKKAARKNAAG